jgi:glycerol-3-phosphate dehydrogenase
VFVIPWSEGVSLVGTTEKHYTGDIFNVSVDEDERSYLLACVNRFFNTQCTVENIQYEFAGVRPLFGSAERNLSRQSREYAIDLQTVSSSGAVFSLYGGKLTTYRALSERVVDQLLIALKKPASPCMTAVRLLPGAFEGDRETMWELIHQQYAWVEKTLLRKWFDRYGLLMHEFLAGCRSMKDLGEPIVPDLYDREICYLKEREWVRCAEDMMLRRTGSSLLNNREIIDFLIN